MRPVAIVLSMMLLLVAGQVRAEPVTTLQAEKSAFAVSDLFVQAQAGAERMVRQIPAGTTKRPPPASVTASMAWAKAWVLSV